jgi:demethylmenaquinone methyltransferase/2-methoxy-6-polyprenyl-1,4-benzoquinol methylase
MKNDDLLTRQHFNNLAADWDSRMTYAGDRIESLLARLSLEHAENILDLGCGTGILFPVLKELTNNGTQVYAIDYAKEMAIVAASKKYEHITPFCADAQNLPFQDEKFDSVIAFQVFPHFADATSGLSECRRVLKDGGELSIIHLRSSEELNDFHATLNGQVKHHKLMHGEEMGRLLQSMNYDVESVVDEPGEYFVRAVKANNL